MIFNIKNRRPASCILIVSLFSVFFLISCSGGEETQSADTTPSAEDYPDQVEDAVAAIERHPAYTEQAAASVESRADSVEHATPTFSRRPAHVAQAGNSVSSPALAEDSNRADEYNVVLGVDETLKIPGLPGELRVWIGSPDYSPDFPERMVQDEATLPALGESAKVQPFAPAFTIEPAETQCIRIHPSGAEVRFTLIPQKQGSFEVGANVYLFDSADCSGSPVPKTAATLKVLVEVDRKGIFIEKVTELWHVAWEKFVEFWAALLAVLFGLVLFLIRGKLKKWFGYGDD